MGATDSCRSAGAVRVSMRASPAPISTQKEPRARQVDGHERVGDKVSDKCGAEAYEEYRLSLVSPRVAYDHDEGGPHEDQIGHKGGESCSRRDRYVDTVRALGAKTGKVVRVGRIWEPISVVREEDRIHDLHRKSNVLRLPARRQVRRTGSAGDAG